MVKNGLCQKNFVSKHFWVKKHFGSKKFLVKNYGQKDLDPIFFVLKKQVGLTQGGGYMTPPPENTMVNIVLDCC